MPVYDRSDLIYAAIETLQAHPDRGKRHRRAGLHRVPAACPQRAGGDPDAAGRRADGVRRHELLGLSSNIMSLGGIAIAIGAMVDAAIVMIENAHKHLERRQPGKPRIEILIEAAIEVGPALFFSLLIITVSFLPIFTLEAQEGRLFRPLAFTKTFAMAAAALLSVTLVPVLMVHLRPRPDRPGARNPINRLLIWLYRPVIAACCGPRRWSSLLALAVLAVTRLARAAARHRVHADAERGHAALHAGDAARDLGHQGGRTAADAGPDHQVLSGGGVASSARPDAPRPRPTRRRPRCSRR